MADKTKVFEAFLDILADAVVAKIAEAGGNVTTEAPEKAPTKPAGKPATGGKKPGAKAPPKVDRDAVYERVKAYSESAGKPAAKALISAYAPAFGEVSDDDLSKLLADVEAAIAEAGETPAEDDEL